MEVTIRLHTSDLTEMFSNKRLHKCSIKWKPERWMCSGFSVQVLAFWLIHQYIMDDNGMVLACLSLLPECCQPFRRANSRSFNFPPTPGYNVKLMCMMSRLCQGIVILKRNRFALHPPNTSTYVITQYSKANFFVIVNNGKLVKGIFLD